MKRYKAVAGPKNVNVNRGDTQTAFCLLYTSVILDIWLMIGKIRNPKCAYDIFDDVQAKILQYESEYIIKESRLFPELLDDAERYVRKHGSEEKNVKKLLNKYKKMKKKESSSMECTNGKIERNVFTDRKANKNSEMKGDRVEDSEKKSMMRHISCLLYTSCRITEIRLRRCQIHP